MALSNGGVDPKKGGWVLRGERGPEMLVLPKGTQVFKGTPHTHSEYVEGCFRCDLSRDEVEGS